VASQVVDSCQGQLILQQNRCTSALSSSFWW
jgi:hypothetical protein